MQDVDWYSSWKVVVVADADVPVVIVASLLPVPRHEIVGLDIASASVSPDDGVRRVVVDSADAPAEMEGGAMEFHASAAYTDDDNHDSVDSFDNNFDDDDDDEHEMLVELCRRHYHLVQVHQAQHAEDVSVFAAYAPLAGCGSNYSHRHRHASG